MSNRNSAADYDIDMQLAKAAGIDAFALNVGTNTFTDQQLDYAYESAAKNDMKVFISYDFNWYSPYELNDIEVAKKIGQSIAKYSQKPAQLKVGNKIFASSFVGDGFNVDVMRNAARAAGRIEVYWVPNFHPGQSDVSKIEGALNWMGWDHNGNNRAPTQGRYVSVAQGDQEYKNWLGTKHYMAPVSPWFFTHFGKEVSYTKNWVFPSDLLWYNRWNEILTLQPDSVQIVSWNDYGESHYVAPLSSKHVDDGSSKWANDMPHNGWLEMAKPYIAAYKAGATSVANYIKSDQIIYWYRPTRRDVNCDLTDTALDGKPNGWQSLTDNVFVVALLTYPGTVTVTSGNNVQAFRLDAGATAFQVPLGVGKQKFVLTRDCTTVMTGTSLKEVSSSCVCGIYNFNAYVGTLPPGPSDPLGPDGLVNFLPGLKTNCAAKPSLGVSPAATCTSSGASAESSATATASVSDVPVATITSPPSSETEESALSKKWHSFTSRFSNKIS
ncbi:glycosyl hydrolase family 71-domain-containing protein [Pseudomassariella vexata]|uniref:Glycosyl hydrolase family 71-domain-containing protein n=1 Tax=Pseudomassariella vexata TaxID=1141098 RepID=A0A1Y2E6M5_9PEZI|nr:glycosyl hydrolase family 71-domain-containing protein [Pseudomassariella vexata]ORY67182.1 glycosyl hydrolase family 71-domain-containing protein [Pseudomassariella vexata]